MQRKKLLFLTTGPTPYRKAFFFQVVKEIELTVLYEINHSYEREWKTELFSDVYKEITLKSWKRSVNDAFCPEVIRYLNKPYDHIIVSGYSTPTSMLAILWLKLTKKKFIMSVDGGQMKQEPALKARIKRFFISSADSWLSTGKLATQYLLHYGAKADSIFWYPFTSLVEKDIFSAVLSPTEKEKLRQKLNMEEKHIVLTVGRFSYMGGYGKGYDALIRAAQRLPADIGWYIVGGAPTEEFANIVKSAGLDNIHFVDFMDKESLKEYYRAADVFTLMTVGDVWGLVINEAMACGLPVITTDKCVAGLELIEEGENGYIVPVGDDKALADRVTRILDDLSNVEKMGRKSLERIQEYTIENMAQKHMEAFERIKKRNQNEDSN